LPKKTVGAIIDSNNDYLIGLKKNQRVLYDQAVFLMANKNNQSSSYTTLEINKGRIEWRQTMVSDSIETVSKDWKGLKQIIGVHRIVKDKGKRREEMAYFISSKKTNAF
jgi:hypothetical protein